MPDLLQEYITDIAREFRRHKDMAEKAFSQLSDDAFFRVPGNQLNSVAIIVKHVGGNLRSRWTDFLTTDGEKPDRNRNGEFETADDETRDQLLTRWEAGFGCVLGSLASLTPADLGKTITIRGEPLGVITAMNRSLAHTAYHTGQITYLSHLLKGEGWEWITIPPGGSTGYAKPYLDPK